MEEREKGGVEREEGEEKEGLKLKQRAILVKKSRGEGRGGGVCTPPPTWNFRPHFQSDPHLLSSNGNNTVTARQLGANLWELLPHLPSLARMNHHPKTSKGFSTDRRSSKGLQMQPVLEDPPPDCGASDEQPLSTGTFHRQIAASLMRHHPSVDRNGHCLRPVSPASYESSTEITPYNPSATPGSSLEYSGRIGDPSCNLKTSTELLKVLNRIWCLEEHHASNASRVKSLKVELADTRTRVKELLREKQMDRQVIDELVKQVSDIKHVKKNMDQDRVQSALQSAREEVEDERKLRKRSESLHRKMAREISETKSSFSRVLSDLERERRGRVLLEDLCDEFAMGIRDYEQEVRSFKYRTEREQVDSLVLHMSEAWLDERVQMKLIRRDVRENGMIVEKLRPEIESFLKARQTPKGGSGFRRQSLESFPLNEATSAPKNVDDEDIDSIDSDSHCFELNANLSGEYSNEKGKGESDGRGLSTLQARFEKHMARENQKEGDHVRNTNHMRNNSSSIEGDRMRIYPEESELVDGNFLVGALASPVKKWDPEISESSSRWNTGSLKARLIEARLEGRNSQSKGSKGSST